MAAHEFGAGAAILISLTCVAAAVAVAFAVVVWRRGLIGGKEFAAVVGLTLVGAILLTLLLSTSKSEAPQAAAPALTSQAELVQRADALLARAIAPNSPLACIDAAAGDQVEEACEAVLFARPETIAAAVSYVTAKVVLLSQASSRGRAEGRADDPALALLQHNLAADRYGIVAHVLEATAGCSAERCDAFALVKDAARIKANLRDSRFDRLVAKHAADWPAPGEHPPGVSDAGNPAAGRRSAQTPASKLDFPSASSIPPVSIMVPEEPRHGSSGENAGTARKPAAKARVPASRPAQAPAAAAPVAVPPASSTTPAAAGASRDQ